MILPKPVDRRSYLYFGELDEGETFKIGFSCDLPQRQRALRYTLRAPGFRIRWFRPGGALLEMRLHGKFAAHALGRELFRFTGPNPVAEVDAAYRDLMERR